jgi:hypothetical protein
MNKFRQIIMCIDHGISFSWSFGGINAPEQPNDNLMAIVQGMDEGKIGYHLQVFTCRHLYNNDLKITFIIEGDVTKIYY